VTTCAARFWIPLSDGAPRFNRRDGTARASFSYGTRA
jgi:hypothetical protein